MTQKSKEGRRVPNLRFPGFGGEWEKKKLGEIAVFSKGKGISKIDIEEDGILECIRYGELYTHYGEVINKIKSKTNTNTSALVLSEANDVVIPASGETTIDIATASCVLKAGIALGGDLNIIKTENNGVFLSYYLNSKKKIEIAKLAQGISVVHLYSSQLALLKLDFPCLDEQTKIASFLTLLDKRINTQIKTIENLKSLKRGLRQKFFLQELRFKNENGNDFPDWKISKLGKVANITMGQSPKSSSYNTEKKGIPLIQGNADITDRKSNPRQYTFKPIKHCDFGDLLLTVRAPVGFVAKAVHNASIGRGICSLSNTNLIRSEFLYQFLLFFENKWTSLEQGSTFSSINNSDIKSIPINIPCLAEQTKIANFLSALDEKMEGEKEILMQYEQQKKYLLQNMFI